MTSVRDPLLRAGDRPAVAVCVGARWQRAGIGARLGLGQREGADLLAARERRHETLALLLVAEREDRKGAGARVHGDRHADTGIRTRELLEHEDVGEEVGAGAAELRRHTDAHQPELGELRVQLGWKPVLAVPGGRVGLDLGLRHVTRERLNLPLVVQSAKFIGRDATRYSAFSQARTASTRRW